MICITSVIDILNKHANCTVNVTRFATCISKTYSSGGTYDSASRIQMLNYPILKYKHTHTHMGCQMGQKAMHNLAIIFLITLSCYL